MSRFAAEMMLLLFFVLFPILVAIILRSTLYDGLKHFLYILPPLAALAGTAAAAFFRSSVRRAMKWVAAAAFALTAGQTLHEMVKLILLNRFTSIASSEAV